MRQKIILLIFVRLVFEFSFLNLLASTESQICELERVKVGAAVQSHMDGI